jgi:hypothetical protein
VDTSIALGFRDLTRRTGLASAALLLLALVAAAGCTGDRGADESESAAAETSEAETVETVSASPTEAQPQTFEALMEDPCAAIDDEEAELLGLHPGPDERHASSEAPGCSWDTSAISLSFSLYPATDAATQAAEWEGGRTTTIDVGGSEAIQSEFQAICIVNVAVDADRSFQVFAIGEYTIQEELCPASVGLAEAVLEDLE